MSDLIVGTTVTVNGADITTLAREIGPRLPGTGKERRAVHYVMRRLREIGVPAALLPVKVPPSFAFIYVVLFCWIAVGVPIAAFSPLIGFVVSLVGLIILGLELAQQPVVSRLFATRRSNNVLGIIPARINDEIGQPARRVILSAHIDTARSGLLWHRSLIRALRALVITLLSCSIIIPILLLAASFRRFSSIWQVAWVPMIVLLLAAILLIESEVRGTALVGANDNASGVAALLDVATTIKHSHTENVETWFLFTTGEEAGLVGMTRFLAENSFEPRETYFINVAQVGAGKIRFTRAEQLIRSRDSAPHLVQLAGEIAGQHPEWEVVSEVYRLLPTDQYVALRQGYQAITIIGVDEHATPPHWHQQSDTIDAIDPATIQIAADLAYELIKRIDAEAVHLIEDTQDLRLPLTDSVAS